MEESKVPTVDEPQTLLGYAQKNAYAVLIVCLIALIAFMFYPSIILTLILSIIVPVLCGVLTEYYFQTEYYRSLGYNLSRLEKTAIISFIVGGCGLGMGYFSENITERLEGIMDF
jgi:ABC-type multidrug transport system fused ATPase/permease subunit